MIIKDLDAFTGSSKAHVAGRKAEEQMAFYLKRAFEQDDKVRVFNNVRLESDSDAAQIDHLILHSHGFILVESKSVTGKVAVNDHYEWVRVYGPKRTGMPSPILQAERQAAFLRTYLEKHTEQLLDKVFGKQTTFTAVATDVLVAISDQGVIQRPKKLALPKLLKADQVASKVDALMKGHQQTNGLFSLNFSRTGRTFSDKELARLTAFLRSHHCPLEEGMQASNSKPDDVAVAVSSPLPMQDVPPPEESTIYLCRHCQSEQLSVVYGKYGYYFKCAACEGNTPIRETCEACERKARVRKQRLNFFAECKDCERSRLFFQNAA